jgi:hypothetical protein
MEEIQLVVGREGVMEMMDGGDVPRVTCQGARQEAACVINEVGDNLFHEFLREFGDGRTCGRHLRSTSTERYPFDPSNGSVTNFVNKQFSRYHGVNTTRLLN